MKYLALNEQKAVRTTLMVFRARIGGWKPLAKLLGYEAESLGKVVTGRRGVTFDLALRLAYFLDMPVDDVIGGKYIPTATCPKCGHVPDFNGDEGTVVDD